MNSRVESPWAKVPLDLMRDPTVTLGDVQVYAFIDYEAGKRGYWHGTQREIVDGTGVSERTVRTAVARLSDLGYITTRRLGYDNRTVLRYWVLARSRPLDDVEPEADDRAAIEIRSLGEELPVTRRGIAGATTSLRDVPTDQTEIAREALTVEHERVGIYARRKVAEVLSPGGAMRDIEYGDALAQRGLTTADVDEAIEATRARGIFNYRGEQYALGIMRGIIEDREAGRERGTQAPGASNGGSVRGRGAGPGPRARGVDRRADGSGRISAAARADVRPSETA